MIDVARMTTEELRELKKQVSDELSRRHKEQEDEKCSCWACGHCFYDMNNAHPSRRYDKGGYRCMAWSKRGRLISTKHKAPNWCPLEQVKIKVDNGYVVTGMKGDM